MYGSPEGPDIPDIAGQFTTVRDPTARTGTGRTRTPPYRVSGVRSVRPGDGLGAESAALVRSFHVGHRLVVITVRRPRPGAAVSMLTEWTPDVPRNLTETELAEYRAGRDAAVRDLAEMLGLKSIAVVEV